MKERIAKLGEQVEALFTLTIRAHERFLFLRPMMVNQQLINRIASEAKGIGFRQLRSWLYWALVQELSKICYDKDPKSPCISKICDTLEKNPDLLEALQNKYLVNSREMGPEPERR